MEDPFAFPRQVLSDGAVAAWVVASGVLLKIARTLARDDHEYCLR